MTEWMGHTSIQVTYRTYRHLMAGSITKAVKRSDLKLFRTTKGNMTEVVPRPAGTEADVRRLVESNVQELLGVRFPASEYGTGPVHGGRIDSLGLDKNGTPTVVESKRGTEEADGSPCSPQTCSR